MKQPKSRNTHVIVRGAEAGGITKADIERRAAELCLIRAGHEKYTEADLQAAESELYGDTTPASTAQDARSEVFLSRDPAEPRGVPGHRSEEAAPEEDDENEEPERLALQGLEEAQHDLMVRARREQADTDEETRR